MASSRIKPRKAPKQGRSQSLVDALLDATAHILLTRGDLTRLSTNEIARVAGVSVGSLYQYFPNKEAVVAALIIRKAERSVQALDDALTELMELPLEQCLEGVLKVFFSAYKGENKLRDLLVSLIPTLDCVQYQDQVVDHGRKTLLRIFERHKEHVRETDLELVAYIFSRQLRGLINDCVLERPELMDDPRLVSELTHQLVAWVRRE